MARDFPERRENDAALIAFVIDSLNNGDDRLKSLFAISDRDIEILDRRFRGGETYQTIGIALDLTKERIRQILLDLYGCFRRPEKRGVWDPAYRGSGANAAVREPSAIHLDQLFLSLKAKKALFSLGVRHLSDLIGKKRRDLHSPHIDRTLFAEIEREIAEHGLVFRETTGKRKDEIICRNAE